MRAMNSTPDFVHEKGRLLSLDISTMEHLGSGIKYPYSYWKSASVPNDVTKFQSIQK